VPVVSAVKPPNDGMTLPPADWMAAMSLPKLAGEIGSLVLPSQYAVHERHAHQQVRSAGRRLR
jgi:hypothetical protein